MQSGPIPRPDILKKYNDLDPGAAKKIINNGVQKSVHRRKMESKSLNISNSKEKRRDFMGFSIGILIILIGGLLIYTGHLITGSIFSGVSAVGLIGEFLE